MSRRRYSEFTMYESDKLKLNAAFACFRQLGLVARQNFYCCGGCAGAAIADQLGTKFTKLWETRGPVATKRAYDKVTGCVFYHQQDAARLRDAGQLYLSYGSVDSTEAGEIGLPTLEVGKRIVEVLKTLGLRYKWDGTESDRIMVDFRDPEKVARREREDAERAARWAQQDADAKLRQVFGGPPTVTADENDD